MTSRISREKINHLSRKILEFSSKLLYFILEMRLSKNQIEHMAFSIIRNMLKEEKILTTEKSKLVADLDNLINNEFLIEDKLDQEVREILNKHVEKIRTENIEYQTLFRMIKTKLAKEKEIVL